MSNRRLPALVPDPIYPGMWRVQWPDGLSDMVNLSRAKDAIASYLEAEERRLRGRRSPRNDRTAVWREEIPI